MKIIKLFCFIGCFAIISLSVISSESLKESINKLSLYSEVAGPIVYRGAQKSEQWKIYEEIKKTYNTEDIVKEFNKSQSVVVKVYLYWALRERNYKEINTIKNEFNKYQNDNIPYIPYGCIISNEKIAQVINDRLENYLENISK